MILINIDQITYIDCGTSATSVIGNPYRVFAKAAI